MVFSLQDLVQLIVAFGSMAGVAALVAVVIDVFKRFGLVQDGSSPRWSAALNLLALIAVVAARYFAPDVAVEFLDAQAGFVAQAAALILSLVMQLQVSPAVHDALVDNESPAAFSTS